MTITQTASIDFDSPTAFAYALERGLEGDPLRDGFFVARTYNVRGLENLPPELANFVRRELLTTLSRW